MTTISNFHEISPLSGIFNYQYHFKCSHRHDFLRPTYTEPYDISKIEIWIDKICGTNWMIPITEHAANVCLFLTLMQSHFFRVVLLWAFSFHLTATLMMNINRKSLCAELAGNKISVNFVGLTTLFHSLWTIAIVNTLLFRWTVRFFPYSSRCVG